MLKEITEKRCFTCKKYKPFKEFGKEKRGKFGLRGSCKFCTRKASDWAGWGRNWREKNKEKVIYFSAKRRAKIKGLEFNISLEDVIIPKICPILGIPIFNEKNNIGDHSPSLDRLDNTKGYIKGNVSVISAKANKLKAHGSLQDFKNLVKWMESKNA